jgi:cobalt-precorrin-5B (C1)-methyltransferase
MSLRRGITTGTTAAGAAKASAISLTGGVCPDYVTVTLPNGEDRRVEIESCIDGLATAIKYSGDDPDVTNGIRITARVEFARLTGTTCCSNSLDEVIIKGGNGIGIVTKAGLQVPVGSHAINPVPMQMIKQAVRQILWESTFDPNGGLNVLISVPDGERIAKKTFNERLGIIGGISIIGTTGIVTPMSCEAVKATIRCEIDVAAIEMRSKILYLSPGKIGETALKKNIGCHCVVQMSNYIGHALTYALDKGIEEIVIGGHPGKLAKLAMGYWDTHSENSPQAVDYVTEFIGIKSQDSAHKKFNTVEEIIEHLCIEEPEENFSIIEQAQDLSLRRGNPFNDLAAEIAQAIISKFEFKKVTIYLFDMKKKTIGIGRCARYI